MDRDNQLVPIASGSSLVVRIGDTAYWDVPDDQPLSTGWQYKWRARADDGTNEGSWSDWQRFSVVADATTTPGVPTNFVSDGISSTSSGLVELLRPTFAVIAGASAGYLRAEFEVRDQGTGAVLAHGLSEYGAAGTSLEWRTPANALVNGMHVTVRARAFDALNYSPWTDPVSLTVQAPTNRPPDLPTPSRRTRPPTAPRPLHPPTCSPLQQATRIEMISGSSFR